MKIEFSISLTVQEKLFLPYSAHGGLLRLYKPNPCIQVMKLEAWPVSDLDGSWPADPLSVFAPHLCNKQHIIQQIKLV